MKLVFSATVVIGRNSPSFTEIAASIAVSAAAMNTWPQITPPECRSSPENGRRSVTASSDTATGTSPSERTQGASSRSSSSRTAFSSIVESSAGPRECRAADVGVIIPGASGARRFVRRGRPRDGVENFLEKKARKG